MRNFNFKKDWRLDLLIFLILLGIIFSLQLIGIFGRTTDFEDGSGMFEGSYRVTLHQVPFKDFFIPYIPLVFYVQAFFNFVFGSTLFSMAIHGFVLAGIICIPFYFLVRKEMGYIMSLIFTVFFYISFNGLQFHPYYNQYASFFFLINIFLIIKSIKKDSIHWSVYLLSAILGTLTFYSKQDLGLLHIFFVFLYFVINYPKKLKSILMFYVVPGIVLLLGSYILFCNIIPGFEYWFNIGQPPHSSRISNLLEPLKLLDIFQSWRVYFCVIFVYFIFFTKFSPYRKRMMSLFIVISGSTLIHYIISNSTRQIFVTGIPLLIFLLYELIKDFLQDTTLNKNGDLSSRLIVNVILVIFLIWAVNPLPTYGFILMNHLNPDMTQIPNGCYAGFLITKVGLNELTEIREVIESNNNSFVSMTDYGFLYCDYNLTPPKNIPLWFHEGVSFFRENVPDIVSEITSLKPQVILIRDPNSYQEPRLDKVFEQAFISKGYRLEKIAPSERRLPIIILVRNESSTECRLPLTNLKFPDKSSDVFSD